MRISRARLTPIVAAGAVLAAALAGVGLPTAPATAAAGCRIDYVPNQWTGGFTANIRISPGDTAVNGWTVTWTWGGADRHRAAHRGLTARRLREQRGDAAQRPRAPGL
ncbi:cellulose binding domain-containing protein, partial [Micromonospora carbonacea]|uniref:cellulose binding domain-containing protein n=1 Tax=Micromonospora carbonacea TaxID=47853 RepID=UPI00331BA633